MTQPRPAEVRFYVDQDLRGAGIVLGSLRWDVTYPGDQGARIHKRTRQPCPVEEGAADLDWLPIVGQAGWLAISRDRNIHMSFSELRAVQKHGVKMVCLTGKSATTKWLQVECILTYWEQLELLRTQDGPFVYKLSKPGGLREVEVDEALDRLKHGRRRRGL
jgi:hypothetical protein